jgi:hypothetical protein
VTGGGEVRLSGRLTAAGRLTVTLAGANAGPARLAVRTLLGDPVLEVCLPARPPRRLEVALDPAPAAVRLEWQDAGGRRRWAVAVAPPVRNAAAAVPWAYPAAPAHLRR